MKTIQQIREELKDIRYYYAKQKQFDGAAKTAFQNVIVVKVRQYNEVMIYAPVRLYDLYISLYVNNNTQEVVAEDWGCSTDYIKQLNKRLCNYLYDELNKKS